MTVVLLTQQYKKNWTACKRLQLQTCSEIKSRNKVGISVFEEAEYVTGMV